MVNKFMSKKRNNWNTIDEKEQERNRGCDVK